jgi:uncharacterized protein (DUF2062 family)
MYARAKALLKSFITKDAAPEKLALAMSVAMYIAWSPFLGLHTIMLIVSGWLFNLNIPFLLAAGYIINNPWTMVPIYMGGYLFGYWVLHGLLGVSIIGLNPVWMEWFNYKIMEYLHIQEISFWAFMIGGNFLGVIFSIITYPIALRSFKTMAKD